MSKYGEGMLYWTEVHSRGLLKCLVMTYQNPEEHVVSNTGVMTCYNVGLHLILHLLDAQENKTTHHAGNGGMG